MLGWLVAFCSGGWLASSFSPSAPEGYQILGPAAELWRWSGRAGRRRAENLVGQARRRGERPGQDCVKAVDVRLRWWLARTATARCAIGARL